MTQPSFTAKDIDALFNAGVLTAFKTKDNSQGFVNPSDFQSKAWLKHKTTSVQAQLKDTVLKGHFQNSDLEPKNTLSEILGLYSTPKPDAQELALKALATALTQAWPNLSNHTKMTVQTALTPP
jgi:hypothetical protein